MCIRDSPQLFKYPSRIDLNKLCVPFSSFFQSQDNLHSSASPLFPPCLKKKKEKAWERQIPCLLQPCAYHCDCGVIWWRAVAPVGVSAHRLVMVTKEQTFLFNTLWASDENLSFWLRIFFSLVVVLFVIFCCCVFSWRSSVGGGCLFLVCIHSCFSHFTFFLFFLIFLFLFDSQNILPGCAYIIYSVFFFSLFFCFHFVLCFFLPLFL